MDITEINKILTKKWKHFPLKRDLCNISIFKVHVQKEMGYVNYPVNLSPKLPSVYLLHRVKIA